MDDSKIFVQPGIEVHACNPNIQEIESWCTWPQPRLYSETLSRLCVCVCAGSVRWHSAEGAYCQDWWPEFDAEIHMAQVENQRLQVVMWPPHVRHGMQAPHPY